MFRSAFSISRLAVGRSGISVRARLLASRNYTASTIAMEKRRIKVPEMGESVREGTIVEWSVKIGEAVKADDVVAMVETDKVTIDIRAEMDGVISDRFAQVDETVDVGGDLYEIDTEAAASVSSSEVVETDSAPESTPEDPIPEAIAASSATQPTTTGHRTPSIKFLGKEGWAKLLSGSPAGGVQVLVGETDPMYGRPAFTEEEMEALMMGGASLV